jgi:uncharacterized protein YndB with AHSA1/START domain
LRQPRPEVASGPEEEVVKIELSQVIDRPPAVVFHFIVVDHVRNHPRWDPKMELQQLSEGPIRVGTIIRRRHTHTGAPTEGSMEVVEYEADRMFGMVIRDGPVEMRSRMTFEPDGQGGTIIRGSLDIPAMKEPIDPRPIEESLRRMKQLIESEG